MNFFSFNLKSSTFFCLSFGDIYFSVSISSSFDSELFVSPVAFAVSIEYLADCLAWSRTFWLYLPLKFYLYFYQNFYKCF